MNKTFSRCPEKKPVHLESLRNDAQIPIYLFLVKKKRKIAQQIARTNGGKKKKIAPINILNGTYEVIKSFQCVRVHKSMTE